jgi:hypothetical protein
VPDSVQAERRSAPFGLSDAIVGAPFRPSVCPPRTGPRLSISSRLRRPVTQSRAVADQRIGT